MTRTLSHFRSACRRIRTLERAFSLVELAISDGSVKGKNDAIALRNLDKGKLILPFPIGGGMTTATVS